MGWVSQPSHWALWRWSIFTIDSHMEIFKRISFRLFAAHHNWEHTSDRLFSIPSLLALHAIFWCFVMLALRHILDWRSRLYVRVIRAQPLRQLLCNIRARQRVSATDLIHYYRKKNILNKLHYYLLTDVDKSLIDMAIDDLKNFAHQQQPDGIT